MRRPVLLGLLLLAGCHRAAPYDARPETPAAPVKGEGQKKEKEEALDEWLAWRYGVDDSRDARIEFIHQGTRPDEWARLTAFWTERAPLDAGGLTGLAGLGAGAGSIGRPAPVVHIKVPLGLDDPTPFIPAANPPTRGKWELGRQLFHDPSWLTAKGGESCATCHVPSLGFANGERIARETVNVPTLVNVVFARRLFWDGRATYLEEVVQQALEDERARPEGAPFRHTWGGVVRRLRANPTYRRQFEDQFGAPPTQDTIGRALATFLRTLLAANSIHDQAVAGQRSKGAGTLLAGHYRAALTDEALADLGRKSGERDIVAGELAHGHALFHGKATCARCHTGVYFSDGLFHNIGVGSNEWSGPNARPLQSGRFRQAPLGEKDRFQIGAYRTPTLRGLQRTRPYFHNGEVGDLPTAVRRHYRRPGSEPNPYLTPLLAERDGNQRALDLTPEEINAVVLYLRALEGDDVDAVVRRPGR